MELPQYQLDAFTAEAFGGNPAAVVPLESWLPEGVMQAVEQQEPIRQVGEGIVGEQMTYPLLRAPPLGDLGGQRLVGRAQLRGAVRHGGLKGLPGAIETAHQVRVLKMQLSGAA